MTAAPYATWEGATQRDVYRAEFVAERDRLEVSSSCRIAGGSGQTHHITEGGCTLVGDGWG